MTDVALEPGQAYYIDRGWSGCAGSAWHRLPPAAQDGWRHAEAIAQESLPLARALSDITTHNGQPLSPANLRWAATHEALCRSFIFDVLMGLADALDRQQES